MTDDIEALRFNTAISQMMVFTNEMRSWISGLADYWTVRLVAAAVCPISARSSGNVSVMRRARASSPGGVRSGTGRQRSIDDTGSGQRKLRGKLEVDAGALREQLEPLAWKEVAEWLQGKEPKRSFTSRRS